MSLQQFYIETHINTDVEDTMKCCEMGIGLVKWRCFKTADFRKNALWRRRFDCVRAM